jgi:hypothetical protein
MSKLLKNQPVFQSINKGLKTPLFALLVLSMSQTASAYTQKTFISELLADHEFFEQEQINVKISKLQMQSEGAIYGDWDLNFSAELGLNKQEQVKHDFDDTGGTGYTDKIDTKTRTLSLDSSKQFFSNGSRLTFSLDESFPIVDESFTVDDAGVTDTSGSAENIRNANISWNLPLMKNKDGIIAQNTYDVAVLDFENESLTLAEIQEDFVERKVFEFIDWVSLNWQMRAVAEMIYRLKDIRSKVDLEHSRDIAIFTKKIDKYHRALLKLKSKLRSQTGLLLASVKKINTSTNPPSLKKDININLIKDINEYVKGNIRELRQINLDIRKNERYIKTYKNRKLANLDFTLSASRNEDTDDSTSYSKSVTDEYEAKIVFSYPLNGDVDNQMNLDRRHLRSRQNELRYNHKLKDVLTAEKRLSNNINHGLEHLKLVKKQIKALEVTEELNLYSKGEGEARFVIIELRDYLDLQQENNETLIDLYKDKLEYDNLMDRLLPKT